MDEHLVRQFERDVVTFLRAHDLLKKWFQDHMKEMGDILLPLS